MPVPNPGLKVDSDNQKVKFLMISGRPKTGFFRKICWCSGPIKNKEPAKAQLRKVNKISEDSKLPAKGSLRYQALPDPTLPRARTRLNIFSAILTLPVIVIVAT